MPDRVHSPTSPSIKTGRLGQTMWRAIRNVFRRSDLDGDWQGLADEAQRIRYLTIAEMLKGHDGSVLDVGCGEALLRSYLPAHCCYVGLEPSRLAAAGAHRRHPSALILTTTAEALQAHGAFTAIVFNESLYYCADPVAVYNRLLPLLAPDGVIVCSIYQHGRTNRECERKIRALPHTIIDDRVIPLAGHPGWHIWIAERKS